MRSSLGALAELGTLVERADELYEKGIAKYDLGQYEEAMDDFNQAIQLNPNEAEYYNYRAYARFGLKQHEKAVEDFNQAIQLGPNEAAFYHGRGNVENSLRQYEKAIKSCNQTIQLVPNEPVYYNSRGIVKCNLGRYEEAVEDFNQAIQLEPNDTKYQDNLRFACEKPEQEQKELQLSEKSSEKLRIWLPSNKLQAQNHTNQLSDDRQQNKLRQRRKKPSSA